MVASDQRDRVAKTFFMKVNQPVAVLIFLFRHFDEDLCAVGKFFTQPLGIGEINPRVIFFGGYCKGQDLLFAQLFKAAFAGGQKTGEHGETSDPN